MNLEINIFVVYLHCIFLTTAVLKTNSVRNYLGSFTPYRFINNKNDSQIVFPDCKDIKIWMITRHGTRLPSTNEILKMNSYLNDLKFEILQAHKQGKGHLKSKALLNFESWSSDIDPDQQKNLVQEGQDEMILLAERMMNRFPNAIKKQYSNETFHFQYTATQRAQQSARYFTLGLFNKKDSQGVLYAPTSKVDPLLRFYKHCDRWQEQVKRNPATYNEQYLFGISSQMNATLETISKRLGLSYILRLEDVILMHRTCAFETAWHIHVMSPWCYAFKVKDAEKLEYYHDLKHYWQDGYGYNLNYQQACQPFKNMIQTLSNEWGKNATFLFTHSGTILKVLAHLELYKPDSHLKAEYMDRDRPWILSKIDAFASNLAFVLYRCKDRDYVLTLHQERPVKLPCCFEELCPLDHIKEYFYESLNYCDQSDLCTLRKSDTDLNEHTDVTEERVTDIDGKQNEAKASAVTNDSQNEK